MEDHAAYQHSKAIKGNIKIKVPVSRRAKEGIKGYYAANQFRYRGYRH
jgi:hypothetical protein